MVNKGIEGMRFNTVVWNPEIGSPGINSAVFLTL